MLKNSPRILLHWLSIILFLGVTAQQPAIAQFRIEVSGVGFSQIPIAFAQFRDESSSPQKISTIVRNDLERSGQYKPLGFNDVVDESQRPDLSSLRQIGADAFVAGSVSKLANGQFEVRFRLWDVVKNEDLGAKSFTVDATDLRLAAHRISDFVYENLSGEKGIFSTRVTYVTKRNGQYNLWISDIDGENAQSALSSPEPIISPSWSPDGKSIAYVSFEQRKPVVYVHKISDATRHAVANFKGSNSAPTWHPNGRSLIVALSQSGSQQLYSIDVQGGSPKKLFQSLSIDTEPVYAADGKTLYFVSDRSGGPQIYKVTLPYGTPERITFNGTYNISPAISPDGKLLAYITRTEGAYKLQLLDIASRVVTSLTETSADERPSFSPNGRLIIYTTQEAGKDSLMMTTTDGRVKSRLAGQLGDMREPYWGPYVTAR
jgi:TolB protein